MVCGGSVNHGVDGRCGAGAMDGGVVMGDMATVGSETGPRREGVEEWHVG